MVNEKTIDFEKWMMASDVGQLLHTAEISQAREIIHAHKPKNVLQLGGLPLLDFEDHSTTHYIHQNTHSSFYSPAHSICSNPGLLPLRDRSIDFMFCPHTHELYSEEAQRVFFQEWSRVLVVGGRIVFFGINLMGVWTLKRLLYHHSLDWGPRISSLHLMQKMLDECGMGIEKIGFFAPGKEVHFVMNLDLLNQTHLRQSFFKRFMPCYMIIARSYEEAHVWSSSVLMDKPDA